MDLVAHTLSDDIPRFEDAFPDHRGSGGGLSLKEGCESEIFRFEKAHPKEICIRLNLPSKLGDKGSIIVPHDTQAKGCLEWRLTDALPRFKGEVFLFLPLEIPPKFFELDVQGLVDSFGEEKGIHGI